MKILCHRRISAIYSGVLQIPSILKMQRELDFPLCLQRGALKNRYPALYHGRLSLKLAFYSIDNILIIMKSEPA